MTPRELPETFLVDVNSDPGRVFLSYATQDRDRARQLAHYLNTRGWAVWWDREIPAGRMRIRD